MQNNVTVKSNKIDYLLWPLVVILIAGMVVGNIYFASYSLSIRLAVIIVVAIIALLLAYTTAKGRWAWSFLKDSRNEMRKVVWPNRQETTRTTIMVIAIVLIMALVIWGVDNIFAYVVSLIIM